MSLSLSPSFVYQCYPFLRLIHNERNKLDLEIGGNFLCSVTIRGRPKTIMYFFVTVRFYCLKFVEFIRREKDYIILIFQENIAFFGEVNYSFAFSRINLFAKI